MMLGLNGLIFTIKM